MGNCYSVGGKKVDDSQSSPQPPGTPGVTGDSKRNINAPTHSSLPSKRSEQDIFSSPKLKAFTLDQLRSVTRNFHDDTRIGEGGFGPVYKGRINEQTLGLVRSRNGMTVAIKKLKAEGYQGHKEWLSEVNFLGKLHHPNLVKLFGYCMEGENRLLIYEYLPKGSLDNHLFKRGAQTLSWEARFKVAISAAQVLSFLHNQQVIYRDFKPSNILLDSHFNAKLSDFGLAKVGPTGVKSHVSTQVIGTEGYAAPEYVSTGQLTTMCDVYSFGVVLLELLSGRRAIDITKGPSEENLVRWAKPYLVNKSLIFRLMDIKLEGQYPRKAAHGVALLALCCIGEAKYRPTMDCVLDRLEELAADKHGTINSSSTSPTSITSQPQANSLSASG